MIRLTAPGARDVVGVEDVRVLVRDELEVPIVVVAERREIVGRRHVQADGVVRERGRRTVGVVGVVGEDDLGDLGRFATERVREPVVARPRRCAAILLGDGLEPLVVVDAKVGRLDRPPFEVRIACCARCSLVPSTSQARSATRRRRRQEPARDRRRTLVSRHRRHKSSWNSGSRLRT